MKIFDVIIHETIVYRPENRAPREQCILQHGFEKNLNVKFFAIYFSSASNRIIAAKDHASIQINIADVDETTGR